jgi:hypothetical protein
LQVAIILPALQKTPTPSRTWLLTDFFVIRLLLKYLKLADFLSLMKEDIALVTGEYISERLSLID